MKKWLLVLTRPYQQPYWWQDVVLAIPRCVAGYWLTVNFGAPKFGLPWSDPDKNLALFEVAFWFPADVAAFDAPFSWAPAFFAWMAAFSEGIGGIAWMLGFQTRVFSFLIAVTMLVAALIQHAHNGLWNMLPALGILWIALYHLILGSGRFGLDAWITLKLNK